MNALPNEIVLKIAEYLHYEDVDSLRRVCRRFHFLLNTNELWQRLYGLKFGYFKNLSALESRLRYNYEFDNVSGDLVEPCIWMRRFAEESALANNFKEINFEQELIPCTDPSIFICGNDRVLFTSKINHDGHCYDQWNIETKICEKDHIVFAFIEFPVSYFDCVGDFAVLAQGHQTVVQVFKNIDGNFKEIERIDVHDDTNYSDSIGKRLTPKPRKKIFTCSFNGRYFIGLSSVEEEPNILHVNIWDFLNMTNVKKTRITYLSELCKVKVNPFGSNFSIVTFTFDNETIINYCTKDHEIFEFTNTLKGVHNFFYDGDHILKVCINKERSTLRNSCLCFCLWKTFDVINEFKSETPSGAYMWDRSSFQMPYFGLLQNQHGIGIVFIFDLMTSKSYRISLEFYVKNIKFIPNERILVCVNNWNWEPFFYIYSIKKPQIIRSFHHLDLSPFNKSRTKLFVRQHLSGEIYVYHFW